MKIGVSSIMEKVGRSQGNCLTPLEFPGITGFHKNSLKSENPVPGIVVC